MGTGRSAYTHLHIRGHPGGGDSGGSTRAQSHRVPWDTPTASWSHGVTQWLRHAGTHSPGAPAPSHRTHRLASPGVPGMHARPTHMAARPLQPPLESPVRCLTSPPRTPRCRPGLGAKPRWSCPQRPQEGAARTLWVGTRLPGGSPTVLGIHSPKLTPAPPTPWAPDSASPASGARCPPPRGPSLLYFQRVPSL